MLDYLAFFFNLVLYFLCYVCGVFFPAEISGHPPKEGFATAKGGKKIQELK